MQEEISNNELARLIAEHEAKLHVAEYLIAELAKCLDSEQLQTICDNLTAVPVFYEGTAQEVVIRRIKDFRDAVRGKSHP